MFSNYNFDMKSDLNKTSKAHLGVKGHILKSLLFWVQVLLVFLEKCKCKYIYKRSLSLKVLHVGLRHHPLILNFNN